MSEEVAGRAGVERELAGFPPTAVTVKVIQAMLSVLPHSPSLPWYAGVDDAATSVFGGVPDDVLERARALLDDRRVDQAMFAARSIDTGDTGLTIVSGVRSALALFLGSKGPSPLLQQQRADAALKALGLAYLLTRLVPRAPEERVALVESVPAGQEILLYYAAIEIALPFAGEVTAAEGTFVTTLVREQGTAIAGKLLGVVGREGVADAQQMLEHLTGLLDRTVLHVLPHTAALADRLRGLMPPALGASGTLSELVATGADALPCYRWLCSRLAVEASLALAKLELMPEVELPTPSSEAPIAAVAPPPPVPEALKPPEDPFAPEAGPEPEPGNPFAPPPDAIVPPESEDAPPPPPMAWPTEDLPEHARLRGAYAAADGRWRVFTKEGVFTEAPPDSLDPDWDAHVARGHVTATYRREGEVVTIEHLDGRTERWSTRRDAYTLEIDGTAWRRADFDLTGRTMEGHWSDGATLLELDHGGAIRLGDRQGRYALGVGSIAISWQGGPTESQPFLSTLRPSSRRPSRIWLAGRAWSLET